MSGKWRVNLRFGGRTACAALAETLLVVAYRAGATQNSTIMFGKEAVFGSAAFEDYEATRRFVKRARRVAGRNLETWVSEIRSTSILPVPSV